MSGVELIREGFLEEVSFELFFELGVRIWVIGKYEDEVLVVWICYW